MTIDASPWGPGAVLELEGAVREYFGEGLAKDDVSVFGFDVGNPKGQEVWESLAALVALRLWRQHWAQERCCLLARGDSVTMLTLVARLKGTAPGISLIGRELALEFVASAYRPILAEHIPGVANSWADALSRRARDVSRWTRPAGLDQATEVPVPSRPRAWCITLSPPMLPPTCRQGG